jgi:hypothetical protein
MNVFGSDSRCRGPEHNREPPDSGQLFTQALRATRPGSVLGTRPGS